MAIHEQTAAPSAERSTATSGGREKHPDWFLGFQLERLQESREARLRAVAWSLITVGCLAFWALLVLVLIRIL